MQFTFKPMNAQSAQAIAAWQYPEPYSFYDLTKDPSDLTEFVDPHNWEARFYAVSDERGELVGFFECKQEGDIVELGLGLRPDLTDLGLGLMFVRAGLAFAQAQFAPVHFRLSVATFNERAIRVYERAGFERGDVFLQHANGGVFEFLHMTRAA